jgi:hypothetical protein
LDVAQVSKHFLLCAAFCTATRGFADSRRFCHILNAAMWTGVFYPFYLYIIKPRDRASICQGGSEPCPVSRVKKLIRIVAMSISRTVTSLLGCVPVQSTLFFCVQFPLLPQGICRVTPLLSLSRCGTVGQSHLQRVSVLPNRGVQQFMMIPFLAEYDRLQGTALLSKAASTYLSIVSAVSSRCGDSLAVKLVTNAYTELLKSYLHEDGRDGYAGRSTSSGSKSASGTECEKCVKGYQLLDLPFGASKGEVKQKRDALAQVLHSDHTGGMSERIRDTAEEQLKSINVAYAHILKCRFSGVAS